jgi:hypothetical protein
MRMALEIMFFVTPLLNKPEVLVIVRCFHWLPVSFLLVQFSRYLIFSQSCSQSKNILFGLFAFLQFSGEYVF